MQFGFIISLVAAILVAVFAIKNGESVTIDLFFTTKEVSQAIVILISAASGAIIVAILGLYRQIKMSFKIKELTKKVAALEKDAKGIDIEVLDDKETLHQEVNLKDDTMNIESEKAANENDEETEEVKQEIENSESNKDSDNLSKNK